MAETLHFPQGLNPGPVTFVAADGTTAKTLLTAGADDTLVASIAATTTDAAANDVSITLYNGTTAFRVGTVRVAALSGSDGAVNAANLLNGTALPWLKTDSAGNRYLQLKAGWSIRVAPLAAVTGAGVLTLLAFGEDF